MEAEPTSPALIPPAHILQSHILYPVATSHHGPAGAMRPHFALTPALLYWGDDCDRVVDGIRLGVLFFRPLLYKLLVGRSRPPTGVSSTSSATRWADSCRAFYSHCLCFPDLCLAALLACYTPSPAFSWTCHWRYCRSAAGFTAGFWCSLLCPRAAAILMLASPEPRSGEMIRVTLTSARASRSDGVGSPLAVPADANLQCSAGCTDCEPQRIGPIVSCPNCSPRSSSSMRGQAKPSVAFCFASTPLQASAPLSTAEECCRAQKSFAAASRTVHQPQTRPAVGRSKRLLHEDLLPYSSRLRSASCSPAPDSPWSAL